MLPIDNQSFGKKEFAPKTDILTPENIAAYVKGCENMGLALATGVEHAINNGQRPTIIIPSRGAIPLYIIAMEQLRKTDPDNILLDPTRTHHYPEGVFSQLSKDILTPGQSIIRETIGTNDSAKTNIEVDVILYPFTADVSTSVGDDEEEAKRIRNSATRSVVSLLKGEQNSNPDFQWYKFLMGKVKDPHQKKFVSLLEELPVRNNRAVFLMDTVISGRASANITEAFHNQGMPLIPVLAENTKQGKSAMQTKYRHTIEHSMDPKAWHYVQPDQIFSQFPIISEDAGPSLLGLDAINFANFNAVGQFALTNASQFQPDFVPQSCIWLPADQKPLQEFKGFIKHCLTSTSSTLSPIEQQQWEVLSRSLRSASIERGSLTTPELRKRIDFPKGAEITKTSSHIISIMMNIIADVDIWTRNFTKEYINNKTGKTRR